MVEMPFPAKNCETRSEEYTGAFSSRTINERSLPNSPRLRLTATIQHLHVERLINSGPFGYKFKLDDTPDVEKVDRHCFHLGLRHPRLLWLGDSP
jgi:hypothetical protein